MTDQLNLSKTRKVCYAMGGIPNQLHNCVVSFFLQVFLLQVVLLSPTNVAIILFIGRTWDAISDPLVGWLVAKTPTTKFGRLIPWITLSIPAIILTYILLWYNNPEMEHKTSYYITIYCLYQTAQTCFSIPYASLTTSLSNRQKDRDSATAYRMTAEMFGMLLGVILQGIFVSGVTKCFTNTSEIKLLNDTSEENNKCDVGFKYLTSAMVASGIQVFCVGIVLLGVKKDTCKPPDITCQDVKKVIMYKPYLIILFGFFFTSMAYIFVQGNFALFCGQILKFETEYQIIIIIVICSAVLAIPFWHLVLSKLGKKITIFIGNLSVVPFAIIMVTVKLSLKAMYFIAFGMGFGIATAFLLPWSVLPDVIETFKIKHPNVNCEVTFYSTYIFFIKLALGISMAVSTYFLGVAGYVSGAMSQPDSINLVLNLIMSVVPIILLLIGLSIIAFYPTTGEFEKKRIYRVKNHESMYWISTESLPDDNLNEPIENIQTKDTCDSDSCNSMDDLTCYGIGDDHCTAL